MTVNNLCAFYTPQCIVPTFKYIGVHTELPSNCKPGEVATLMICLRGGKTIYRNYICYEDNVWSVIEDEKLKDAEESEESNENSN